MKKKLISMAVAAAMAAPAAAMAEAIIYGKLHVSIDYADVTNGYSTPVFQPNGVKVRDGIDFNGWGVNGTGGYMPGAGRAQRVGVKGSEDIGNGLKAIYQFEMGFAMGASDNSIPGGNKDSFIVRNSFVGLAGSFGSVLVGRHDTPLKISTGKLDMFADTMADYNGTVGFEDLRVDNAIAYISPSFSGFQFMGALVAPGGATAGSTYTLGNQEVYSPNPIPNGPQVGPAILDSGANTNVNSDQLNGAYSLAAIYNNGPYYASIAYESLSNEMFMDSEESLRPSYCRTPNNGYSPVCATVGDDYNKWRFGLGLLDWNGFTVGVVYESQDDVPGGQVWGSLDSRGTPFYDGINSQELWQVQAGYAFGSNQVKAMYGQASRDYAYNKAAAWSPAQLNELKANDGDRSTWALAFDHNFSKRTKAYVLYTDVDDDLEDYVTGASWSGFSLGMIHNF